MSTTTAGTSQTGGGD
jgi:anaerobic ribonucleoside-triphosphate reductase